jgi:hypothetical protein
MAHEAVVTAVMALFVVAEIPAVAVVKACGKPSNGSSYCTLTDGSNVALVAAEIALGARR